MKILIAVLACWKYDYPQWVGHPLHRKTDHRLQALLSTWWPEIKKVEGMDGRFFLGRPSETSLLPAAIIAESVVLDVADDYNSVKGKTRAMCAWACATEFDWIVPIDDDTAVDVPFLARTLESLDYDYAGQVIGDYCYGGAGLVLSKRAAEIIASAEVPDDAAKQVAIPGDIWVAKVLKSAEIMPNHIVGFNDGSDNGLSDITHHCRLEGQMDRWWKDKQHATV